LVGHRRFANAEHHRVGKHLLIAPGEHPKAIQERLGHVSIKSTLDTYGHLFEGLDEAAAATLWHAIPTLSLIQ
jgi:integrase